MLRRCAGECDLRRVSSLPRKGVFFKIKSLKINSLLASFSTPKRSRTRDGAVNLRRVTKRRDERRVATWNASVEWEAVPAGAAWVN
jgi:hypothetical protein